MSDVGNFKEYINPEGKVELQISFESNKVIIEDAAKRQIIINDTQARWLGTELDAQFGGGPQNLLDSECVIIFTGPVNEESVQNAQRELLRIAFREKKNTSNKNPQITLIINTFGGMCAHGLALYDTIETVRGMGVRVCGLVQGSAFSMGSVILQACSVRLVARHSRIMVHQVTSLAFGKLNEMEDQLEESSTTNKRLAEIYAERNTCGLNNVTYWLKFMRGKDKYIDPQNAVNLGLADAIYQPLIQWDIPLDVGEKK